MPKGTLPELERADRMSVPRCMAGSYWRDLGASFPVRLMAMLLITGGLVIVADAVCFLCRGVLGETLRSVMIGACMIVLVGFWGVSVWWLLGRGLTTEQR